MFELTSLGALLPSYDVETRVLDRSLAQTMDDSSVIALAMVINVITAGLAGVLVPVAFERLDQDPAVASSVFVTMITDSMGFFAFLGLAVASGIVG